MSRPFLVVILLAAALVGPAVYFNDSWTDWNPADSNGSSQIGLSVGNISGAPVFGSSRPDFSPAGLASHVSTIPVANANFSSDFNPSQWAANLSPPPTPFPQTLILPGDANGPDFNAIPLEFVPVIHLGEIFRFDVGPQWVKQRWERVSNSPGNAGLNGLRVPLVTGVNTYDLFGSMTYYFDRDQVLQKITFRGWSGNPEGLVQLVTREYGFKNQPTSSAGLYLGKRLGQSTGVLYMQHPNVIRVENPTQQVAILLEINNPDGSYELNEEVSAMVFHSPR